MIWFLHLGGRVPTTRTHLPQRAARVAILGLACLTLGTTSSPASPSGPAETNCRIVVAGAPWKVAAHSGSTYTLAARGMACATARPWAVHLTHETAGTTGKSFKGPSGFTCRSFSIPASGDKLLYAGVCMKGPHNHPFFEWGPKV